MLKWKSKKRSLTLDEISEIKKTKLNIKQCIVSFKSNIEKYSLEAKEKQGLILLSKAISFRKAVAERQDILEAFTQTISELQKELWIDTVEVFVMKVVYWIY